jgi:lipopolysaccharide biosynthesis protein
MKSAIVLHLYYQDLWKEFKEVLLPVLSNTVDLYVTIVNPEDKCLEDIRTVTSNVEVVPNKGMDIGPFFLTYKKIRGKYKTITKIHSKKSLHTPGIGEHWRRDLYIPILKAHESLSNHLAEYKEPAMVGVGLYTISDEQDPGRNTEELQQHIRNICKELNIAVKGSFIAGTMFMVNDVYMNSVFTDDIIDKIYNMFEDNYIRDNSAAHAMERIFGYLGTQTNLLVI